MCRPSGATRIAGRAKPEPDAPGAKPELHAARRAPRRARTTCFRARRPARRGCRRCREEGDGSLGYCVTRLFSMIIAPVRSPSVKAARNPASTPTFAPPSRSAVLFGHDRDAPGAAVEHVRAVAHDAHAAGGLARDVHELLSYWAGSSSSVFTCVSGRSLLHPASRAVDRDAATASVRNVVLAVRGNPFCWSRGSRTRPGLFAARPQRRDAPADLVAYPRNTFNC